MDKSFNTTEQIQTFIEELNTSSALSMDNELEVFDYFDSTISELISENISAEEAFAIAKLRFGNTTTVKDDFSKVNTSSHILHALTLFLGVMAFVHLASLVSLIQVLFIPFHGIIGKVICSILFVIILIMFAPKAYGYIKAQPSTWRSPLKFGFISWIVLFCLPELIVNLSVFFPRNDNHPYIPFDLYFTETLSYEIAITAGAFVLGAFYYKAKVKEASLQHFLNLVLNKIP